MYLPSAPAIGDETFENFDTMGNETLIKAKVILETLADKIIESNGNLKIPLIIGLQGNPGVGKTHLLRAFQNKLSAAGIKYFSSKGDKYLITQRQDSYNKIPGFIVVVDDFLQEASSLAEAQKEFGKGGYELKYMPEFLFALYEMKGICIISSNFDINNILKLITDGDSIGRLKSRINQLLGSVQPIHINAPDYRDTLAQKENPLTAVFADAVEQALVGVETTSEDTFSELRILVEDFKLRSNFLSEAEDYLERGQMSDTLAQTGSALFKENDKYKSLKETAIKIFFNSDTIGNTTLRHNQLIQEFHPDKYANGKDYARVIKVAKEIVDIIGTQRKK